MAAITPRAHRFIHIVTLASFADLSTYKYSMVTKVSNNVIAAGALTTGLTGSNLSVSTLVMGSSFLRNRIINGDMRVFQRNTVANTNGEYSVDRWRYVITSTGTAQATQSQVSPEGFTESILFDVVTVDTSIAASELAALYQSIEGYNISDLYWGAVGAKSVTLSFWVYSTTTGTFCVSFRNGSNDRSYIAEYTINAINTWEYKTITVPGPTTGTWDTTNGEGLSIIFTVAVGTTYRTTANAWASGNFLGTANQTNLLANAANSIRFTGVQLEEGTVATPFERQLYNAQLAQCQRYYYRVTAAGTSRIFGNGYVTSATIADFTTPFPVTMRDEPSALEQTGTAANYIVVAGAGGVTCSAVPTYLTSTQWGAQYRLTVASGLTTGQAVLCRSATGGTYLGWSAEF